MRVRSKIEPNGVHVERPMFSNGLLNETFLENQCVTHSYAQLMAIGSPVNPSYIQNVGSSYRVDG